jgi:endonuclease III
MGTRISASLRDVVARLEQLYGRPKPPPSDPFELILGENCAYLVDDERRARVFMRLKREVGLKPEAILAQPLPTLAAVIKQDGGMHPLRRAQKLKTAAELVLEIGSAEFRRMVQQSPEQARKVLRRFPGIGEPGADKILLFCHSQVGLGPDSNALRVVVRLGYGREDANYARKYRLATEALAPDLPADFTWLVKAHQLLRRHGQELCRRDVPLCGRCPLSSGCRWYLART